MALSNSDLDYLLRYVGPLLSLRADVKLASLPPGPPTPKLTALAVVLDDEIAKALNKIPGIP